MGRPGNRGTKKMSPSGDVFGALAQLVARFHGMEEVRGSNPLCSTMSASTDIRCVLLMTMAASDGSPLLHFAHGISERFGQGRASVGEM